MKLSSGVDLIEIDRIQATVERFGNRFLERVYTAQELEEARDSHASLAARFAAKEAVAKALGSGIGPVCWQEIEICRGDQNQPFVRLHGEAQALAARLGLSTWSISLSHTATHAIALAIALSDN